MAAAIDVGIVLRLRVAPGLTPKGEFDITDQLPSGEPMGRRADGAFLIALVAHDDEDAAVAADGLEERGVPFEWEVR